MNWVLIRASGVIAYLLLSMSVLWGLALAGRMVKHSPKSLNLVHESLSVGALIATVLHIVFLSVDRFVEFDLVELFVPGASDWRPVAVTFGVLAFYGMILVSVSFYLRSLIGQQVWRGLHYSSFGIWLAVLVHWLLAGTDRLTPWAIAIYSSTTAAVLVLLAIRLRHFGLQRRSPRAAEGRGADKTQRKLDEVLSRSED